MWSSFQNTAVTPRGRGLYRGLLELDLDETVLRSLDDLDPDYDPVHALFWADTNAPLRADPRFIRFMERQGAFPLWHPIAPPTAS